MPTIETGYEDLLCLVGRHVPLDELREKGILFAKGEIDEIDGETLKIDIKDTNRPDLWSAEGIAREIAGRYGRPGLPEYSVAKPSLEVRVDPKVARVRPYTVCAVVRGLDITENVLSQLIQLQEKVSETYGKRRKEVAIGVYDLHKIKGPVRYTTVKPDGIRFVPLEFSDSLTPRQILEQHPKGQEYRHLLEGCPEYPIFIDDAGEVLSLPPIINSNHTGKVTSQTKDVFIECSGFSLDFNMTALNVLVAALADRGAKVEGVRVVYPRGHLNKTIVTPVLKPKKISVDAGKIRQILGIELKAGQITELLEQARYKARPIGDKIEATYPAYRQDIMHWRDVAEDVAISYGYGNAEPATPMLATVGKENRKVVFSRELAQIMIGTGFQEVMSYMLTNKDNIFRKMETPEGRVAEIENVVSSNWSVFRDRILPGLLEFLSKNKHREYPQKVFETGTVIIPDSSRETRTKDEMRTACAISGVRVGYEEISSVLEALLSSMGAEYSLRAEKGTAFIEGRHATVIVSGQAVGEVGEIHPEVLNNWGLEKPVAAFELNTEKLHELISI